MQTLNRHDETENITKILATCYNYSKIGTYLFIWSFLQNFETYFPLIYIDWRDRCYDHSNNPVHFSWIYKDRPPFTPYSRPVHTIMLCYIPVITLGWILIFMDRDFSVLTYTPYIIHCSRQKPVTQLRGFYHYHHILLAGKNQLQ